MLSSIIFGAIGGLLVIGFLSYRGDHKNETLPKALIGFVKFWVGKIRKMVGSDK